MCSLRTLCYIVIAVLLGSLMYKLWVVGSGELVKVIVVWYLVGVLYLTDEGSC